MPPHHSEPRRSVIHNVACSFASLLLRCLNTKMDDNDAKDEADEEHDEDYEDDRIIVLAT